MPPPKDDEVGKKPTDKSKSETNIDPVTKNAPKNAAQLLAGGGAGVIGYKVIKHIKKSNKTVLKGFKRKAKI